MITYSLNQDFRLLSKLGTQKAYVTQCGLCTHALHQTSFIPLNSLTTISKIPTSCLSPVGTVHVRRHTLAQPQLASDVPVSRPSFAFSHGYSRLQTAAIIPTSHASRSFLLQERACVDRGKKTSCKRSDMNHIGGTQRMSVESHLVSSPPTSLQEAPRLCFFVG